MPRPRFVARFDGSYCVPRFTSEQAGRAGRVIAGCALAVGLFYCGSVADEVIQDLRAVQLIRAVLHRVSAGDAILTWFGSVFGRDLLRSVVRQDPFERARAPPARRGTAVLRATARRVRTCAWRKGASRAAWC